MDQETVVKLLLIVAEIGIFVLLCHSIVDSNTQSDITPEIVDNVDKTIKATTNKIPVSYFDILSYNPKLFIIILIIVIVLITLIAYYNLYIKDKESHKNILNKP